MSSDPYRAAPPIQRRAQFVRNCEVISSSNGILYLKVGDTVSAFTLNDIDKTDEDYAGEDFAFLAPGTMVQLRLEVLP